MSQKQFMIACQLLLEFIRFSCYAEMRCSCPPPSLTLSCYDVYKLRFVVWMTSPPAELFTRDSEELIIWIPSVHVLLKHSVKKSLQNHVWRTRFYFSHLSDLSALALTASPCPLPHSLQHWVLYPFAEHVTDAPSPKLKLFPLCVHSLSTFPVPSPLSCSWFSCLSWVSSFAQLLHVHITSIARSLFQH